MTTKISESGGGGRGQATTGDGGLIDLATQELTSRGGATEEGESEREERDVCNHKWGKKAQIYILLKGKG